MDPSEALTLPGVKAYVNSDDVPGDNVTGDGNDEEVFATDKVNGSVAQKQKKLQVMFTRKQFQIAEGSHARMRQFGLAKIHPRSQSLRSFRQRFKLLISHYRWHAWGRWLVALWQKLSPKLNEQQRWSR